MAKTDLFFKKNLDSSVLFICILVSFSLIFSNSNEKIQSFRSNSLDTFSFLYKPFDCLDDQLFLIRKLEVLSQENLKLNLENQILESLRC